VKYFVFIEGIINGRKKYGYFGKILKVNLPEEKIEIEICQGTADRLVLS